MKIQKWTYIALFIALAGCDQKKESVPSLAPVPAAPRAMQTIPLLAWNADAEGVVVTSSNEVVSVEGNDTRFGYQISTPPQAIQPNIEATVQMKMHVDSGRVCVGVLDETRQSWILSPSDGAAEMHFNSGVNKLVHVVLANCNEAESGNPKSRFSIEKATLSFGQKS